MTDLKLDDFVNVSVRIRPILSQDSSISSCLQVISKNPPVLFVTDKAQTYHFDNIFTDDVPQETVYKSTVKPLVQYVKQGYNCTIFAYGQTGTGKTYTMGTNPQFQSPDDLGLIPRTLDDFFEYDENTEVTIAVSFIEIYNERVYDLLTNRNSAPLIVKGFKVQDFSKEKVYNSYEAKHFLHMGNKNRHVGETKQNSKSSRSHAIFTIYCDIKNEEKETIAKLNLVDLAGCESVRKTGTQGSTFHEGVNINKGLLCIGQVMTALSSNSNHIPYRQSIITTILQDSLNKKNYVSLIACINNSTLDVTETTQTLEFAHRVKKMKNKPEVNQVISQYKKENPALFTGKINNTPFKRTIPSQYFTPAKCLRTPLPLSTIPEPMVNSTAVDSPKSLFSMSVSSISSDVAQQSLSPVIKKYVTAMEVSLMDKLETVIRKNLRRSARLSTAKNEKENTPGLSWNKIQAEVSKMVRTQIEQLAIKSSRATSSPIKNDHELSRIRKVLAYDSPKSDNEEYEENLDTPAIKEIDSDRADTKSEDKPSPIFKVPRLPKAKHKKGNSNMLNKSFEISPIEVNCSVQENNSHEFHESDIDNTQNSTRQDSVLQTSRRCSRRLASKKCEDLDNTLNISEMTCNESAIDQGNNNRRVSVRLAAKRKNVGNCICISPKRQKVPLKTPIMRLKIESMKPKKDSPITAHGKEVLNILNVGNLRQVEKLHTIGTKSAEQIILFRKLRGGFKDMSDLLEMPGWSDRRFSRFLQQNFLRDTSRTP